MIIAGNSHVSIFRYRLKNSRTGKPVKIKWVGAITADHFLHNHSAARAIKFLFSQTSDWKFLSIGMHDIFCLCKAFTENRYEKRFTELIALYKNIFLELNTNKKFGWLISPQQLIGPETYGLPESRVFDISLDFNKQVTGWCVEEGIVVINPLDNILGINSLPKEELLQTDGIHLNDSAIEYYINEINEKTKEKLSLVSPVQSSDNILYARNEPESLSLLVADELGLSWDHTKLTHGGRNVFEDKLGIFMSDLLSKKGVSKTIDRDTEYNHNSELSSVDLVEIYTFANGLMGDNINFDVNIRKLTTIEKISEFIFKNKPLTINDFFETLTPDTTDKIRSSETFLADSRIAEMRDDTYSHLKEIIHLQTGGSNFSYGIIYFWFALIEAQRDNYGLAISLLENAEDINLKFPFQSSRIEYYKNLWKSKQIENQNKIKTEDEIKSNKNNSTHEKIDLWWPEGKFVHDEDDLLREFGNKGKGIRDKIEILYAAGVYDLNKCRLYFDLFTKLKKIYLFMPVANVYEELKKAVYNDNRIEAFPYALTDKDGYDLLVLELNTSSLNLHMGEQSDLISGKAISVECRSLENIVSVQRLPLPDMIVYNVRGMEHTFFSSIPPDFLSEIKVNYFTTRKNHFCHGSGPDKLFDRIFNKYYEYFGCAPLSNSDKEQCNVLFLNRHYLSSIHEQRQKQKRILEKEVPLSVLKREPNLADEKTLARITEIGEKLCKHGKALLESGDTNDAFSSFAMAVEIIPEHVDALYNLGMLLWKNGKPGEAEKCFSNAFRLDVSNKKIASSFAEFYIKNGTPSQAKKILKLCLRKNPDDKTFIELLSSIVDPVQKAKVDSFTTAYQDIQTLLKTGRINDARKALEKMIDDFPECALAHNDLGVLFCQMGNNEKALIHYEKAVLLEPGNITFQKNIADFYYFVLGRVEDSLRTYTKILTDNPEDIETLMIMGNICVSIEQFKRAKALYKRILEIDPKNQNALKCLDDLDNIQKVDLGTPGMPIMSQGKSHHIQ